MKKHIYLVGGAVRDQIIGLPSQDKDYVAVGYEPSDFSHLEMVGKDFPVFLLPSWDELALARLEKKVSSGYNGFSCETKNVTLEEDLQRRDLTINSIAYDEKTKQYIDPFNGIKDIENKLLRHTSLAFKEDPLRVLRLARFQAKFGKEWSIAKETKKLVISMQDELMFLKKERVYKEINKVLEYKQWYLFFEFLHQLNLLKTIFPLIFESINKDKSLETIKTQNISSKTVKLALLYTNIDFEKNKEFDIQLPKKQQNEIKKIVFNIKKLQGFYALNMEQKINFFQEFKKNKKLLLEFFEVCKVIRIDVDYLLIEKIFDQIDNYSPKNWIENQVEKPNPKLIIEHLKEKYKTIILSF